jgi:hypothetical protein
MAVVTSRWAATIDALIAAVNAAPAFANVYVFDGPPEGRTGMERTQRLWVGTDSAASAGPGVAVDETQAVRSTSGQFRDGRFDLHCVAEGWSGDPVMKTARDLAVAVYQGVETLLRPTNALPDSNATLSGTVAFSEITVARVEQEQRASGALCQIHFTIAVRELLTQ